MEPIKKLLKQASTQIDREREQFANTLGITGVQMSVIDFLSNQPDNTADQHAIEREFGIKRSTTTIMVQRMEKHDLIKRIDDPEDKRKKKVKLTTKSLLLVDKIKDYMTNDDVKIRKQLTQQEMDAFIKIMNLIRMGDANE